MRAALIVLGDDPPVLTVAGLSWTALRLRSAVRAGARHIVVVAQRVTPEVVAAIDEARTMSRSIVLARTAAEAADAFHPDEPVLLLSGSRLFDDASVAQVAQMTGDAVGCVPITADASLELIDASARWSGLARLTGDAIRHVASTVGDWDFTSLLLRALVSGGATRIELDAVPPAATEANVAGRFARRLVDAGPALNRGGWSEHLVIDPLARATARALHASLKLLVVLAPWLAACLLIGALVAAGTSRGAAAPLLIAATLVFAIATVARSVSGVRPTSRLPARELIAATAALALLMMAWRDVQADVALALALVLMATTVLDRRLAQPQAVTVWLADITGHAIVISMSVIALGGIVPGLGFAVVHAFASLGWRQNALSRALTSPR